MNSEKQKMLAGELYNASDPVLLAERKSARKLIRHFNDSGPEDIALRNQILHELLGNIGKGVNIEPPFFCDYGYNLFLGENVYFNFNCTVLDVNYVNIGTNTLIGPCVHIYTAIHPMHRDDRILGLEYSKPVSIGDDVWIGGCAIICPGVNIGSGSVIGAGSVVTRDIPPGVFAAGNPCRMIRHLKKK